MLLEAFSLIDSEKNYKLIVLGEGELIGDLHKQARALKIDSRVDFLGFVETHTSTCGSLLFLF